MMKIDSKPNFLRSLAVGFMVYGLVFSPALVFALPTGGVVAEGTAAITQSGGNMSINQTTNKVIVNWNGFSIDAGESVQFSQPDVNSVALNRVVGSDPSLIMGSLSANGQIFVVNPSGVYLGANAQVDAHGFLATTLGISDEDFMNGTYEFAQDPGMALSSVVNNGMISAIPGA